MAAIRCCVVGLGVLVASSTAASAGPGAGPVELVERNRPGGVTRVEISLSARGEVQLGGPFAAPPAAAAPGTAKEPAKEPVKDPSTTFPLKSDVKIDYIERVLKADDRGRATRVARRALRAASAVNVGTKPTVTSLRGAVALLGASAAPANAGGVVIVSPLGPLTRAELDILETPGDPLTLVGLLPEKAVAVGDRWKVAEPALQSLSSYDTIASSTLEGRLEAVDDDRAVVRLRGEVRGSRLGGEGTIACDGTFTVDRANARVDSLKLDRAETRRPGLIEAGLDVRSTLSVSRKPAEAPPELGDGTLAKLAMEPDAERLRLLYVPPGGRYALTHGRDWQLEHEDVRGTVLKRVEGGRLVAQCNLARGPNAGKGRHQDLSQFRDDVRKGLGRRFVQFLGEGEVEGDPAGHFRHKVGVQGRQDELGVIWYYYLIAAPEGDQVVATFTLADTHLAAFGDQDERLIGSFRWLPAAEQP